MIPNQSNAAKICLLLATWQLVSCGGQEIKEIVAPAPLERVVVRPSGEVTIYSMEGVELTDLIDLSPFLDLGLRPGMAIDEVEARLGSPDAVGDDRKGRDEVYIYQTERGQIEIVKQHVSSEGAEVDRWFLRIRPAINTDLVHPSVLRHPPPQSGWAESILILAGPQHESVGKLQFEEGQLKVIWWLG